MFNFIKEWRCEHDYEFVRNIYGDEINWCGGYRSEWRCKKCGKSEYRRYLQTTTIIDKLDKLYDKYYQDKYENWCNEHKDILNKLLSEMMHTAEHGECSIDFLLACKESTNDKYYYEKWFTQNKLKTEITLQQEEKCLEVNIYKFHVRWKYKY